MAKTAQQRKLGACARSCKGNSKGKFKSCMKSCLSYTKLGPRKRRRKSRR
jgi:hypothetical protein